MLLLTNFILMLLCLKQTHYNPSYINPLHSIPHSDVGNRFSPADKGLNIVQTVIEPLLKLYLFKVLSLIKYLFLHSKCLL